MRRAILVAAFLLAACHGTSEQSPQSSPEASAPEAGSPAATPAAPTATLSVVDPSGAAGPFALQKLRRLAIRVEGEHLAPGIHEVRVDVVSPLGSVYAQLPAVLSVDATQRGSVSAVLQVRGSTMQSFRETGSWQLVANVDGAPLAAASVDLTE